MMLLKLLTLGLQPVGTALCVLLLALLCWRRRRLAGALVLFALGWLWLWATPLAADALQGRLEQRFAYVEPAALPVADVILVLGGGIEPGAPPQFPAVNLEAAADRVLHAAALYHAGRAPRVMVSGGRLPWTPGSATEADAMHALLRRLGVPAAAILREDRSRTTRENLRHAAPLLRDLQARRLLLVTSAWHMPRALAGAAQLGVEVIPAPTDFEVLPGRRYGVFGVLPDSAALHRSARGFKEGLGLLYGRAVAAG